MEFVKPGPWSFESKSGAVDPYGKGYGSEVAHTLGRFNSNVNPDKTSITMTDTYDMENEIEEIKWMQEQYLRCLAKESNLTVTRLKKMLKRQVDVYLSAEEAVEFGIADEVV